MDDDAIDGIQIHCHVALIQWVHFIFQRLVTDQTTNDSQIGSNNLQECLEFPNVLDVLHAQHLLH